jgi:hypothetical protein
VQGNVQWLQRGEVLPTLLRANLHTRQYADLVGRVLKRLAPHERGIADSDLTFLWNLTQKVFSMTTYSVERASFLGMWPHGAQ